MDSRCPECHQAIDPKYPETSHSTRCPNRNGSPAAEAANPEMRIAAKLPMALPIDPRDEQGHSKSRRRVNSELAAAARRTRWIIVAIVVGCSLLFTCTVSVPVFLVWRTVNKIEKITDELSKEPPMPTQIPMDPALASPPNPPVKEPKRSPIRATDDLPWERQLPAIELSAELKLQNVEFDLWSSDWDGEITGVMKAMS